MTSMTLVTLLTVIVTLPVRLFTQTVVCCMITSVTTCDIVSRL